MTDELTARQKRMLAVIGRRAGEDGWCPAAEVGSMTKPGSSVLRLSELGLIEVAVARVGSGGGVYYKYRAVETEGERVGEHDTKPEMNHEVRVEARGYAHEIARLEGEVGAVRARWGALQRICDHPNKYERSFQGERCEVCPDCEWQS